MYLPEITGHSGVSVGYFAAGAKRNCVKRGHAPTTGEDPNLLRKIVLLGSTAALVAGSLFIGTGAHAGTPPVDASHDTVTCDTILKGTAGFKPALNGTGGLPTVITIKGSLAGCTTNDSNITSISGSIKGTLNAPDNNFLTLLGPSSATGTITITWKTVPALVTKTTTITIASGNIVGATNSPFGDSATYGQFNISGAAQSGSFGGNNNGASSFTHAITVEDAGYLLAQGSGAKGLKAVTLGSSELSLG